MTECSTPSIGVYGNITWKLNGQLHREDGPAVQVLGGCEVWFQNGKCHRKDGPAIECPDGTKEWFQNGKLHREDGPAIEKPDGTKKWYKNGEEINPSSSENSGVQFASVKKL